MKQIEDVIRNAFDSLESHVGLNTTITFENNSTKYDATIDIGGERFIAEVKSSISTANKGNVLLQLMQIKEETNFPVILITKYIPKAIAEEFSINGINYLDIAGNCNIRQGKLFICLEGKKTAKVSRTNQSRAFQEAGIRLIFALLSNPDFINLTYRELAKLSELSLGSVGNVMQELEELHFILKNKNNKVLKNRRELLDRWVVAYNDVLRPRLILRKMRFVDKKNYLQWRSKQFHSTKKTLWGGEPAASFLTNNLSPEEFTIYTNGVWQDLVTAGLIPAEDGDVEILKMFWSNADQNTNSQIVPPLIIYADLIGSGKGRNIETAKMILDNELQNIK